MSEEKVWQSRIRSFEAVEKAHGIDSFLVNGLPQFFSAHRTGQKRIPLALSGFAGSAVETEIYVCI